MATQSNASTSNSISSTIDRITTNALAASSGGQSNSKFIQASTWQGAKPGYYFGTSERGTGYHWDKHQHTSGDINGASNGNGFHGKISKRSRGDDTSDTAKGSSSPPTQRRRVRFGEDQIKTIPALPPRAAKTRTAKPSPEDLLEQAEKEQASSKSSRKTLDLSSQHRSRGQSSLKHVVRTLEKSIATNGLLRADHADNPESFMESELALYNDIEVLNDLATNVEYYTYFVELGAVDQLVMLLGHENVDVALTVIRLFVELLDPALFVDGEEKERMGLSALMKAFVGGGDDDGDVGENGGLGMAIGNLSRLSDTEEEEAKGVDDIITLVENMLDMDQMGILQIAYNDNDGAGYVSVASTIAKSTKFVTFVMQNLCKRNDEGWRLSMKLHGSEVLASIIQHEDTSVCIPDLCELEPFSSALDDDGDTKKKPAEKVDGMECLLQCIARYRKNDPASEEECEYIENLFSCLAASLLNEKNVDGFLEREGVELMLRCINERVHSGSGSMKVLFFAMSGSSKAKSMSTSCSKRAAEVFVDAGGFKSLFPIFMGKRSAFPKPSRYCDAGNLELLRKYAAKNREKDKNRKKQKSSKKMKRVVAANKEWFQTLEAHSIHLLYGLTRHLGHSSPNDAYARLLSKFVEKDCEKCDRMVELCLKYDIKMRQAEYGYYKSDEAEEAEANGVDVDLAALNAKLEGGGELFHRISAVIAFAAQGSKRCHEHILEQLRTQNSGIGVIKAAIEEFVSILDKGGQREQLENYLLVI